MKNTKIILITLNIIALLGAIYWLMVEHKPEPFITLILTILNLLTLSFEEKINKVTFKSDFKVENNYGSTSGSIQNQFNNFGNHQIKETTQTEDLECLNTINDGTLAILQPIKEKPNGSVNIFVNGVHVSPGDGHKNSGCYFSSDEGQTAKYLNHLDIGDKLFWNGSIAGYQLTNEDFIRFSYKVQS